jgi:hypothetical protein
MLLLLDVYGLRRVTKYILLLIVTSPNTAYIVLYNMYMNISVYKGLYPKLDSRNANKLKLQLQYSIPMSMYIIENLIPPSLSSLHLKLLLHALWYKVQYFFWQHSVNISILRFLLSCYTWTDRHKKDNSCSSAALQCICDKQLVKSIVNVND